MFVPGNRRSDKESRIVPEAEFVASLTLLQEGKDLFDSVAGLLVMIDPTEGKGHRRCWLR